MVFLETLLPIFAVIALGWLIVRSGYLGADVVAPAGQIVVRVALPAVIFLALATTRVQDTFDPGFLLAYAVGSLAVMGICFGIARQALGLSLPVASVVALGVSMANSGFLGFPIGQALLGADAAIRVFAHCLIVENLVILPIALTLLALAGDDGVASLRTRLARDVLRNPLMIALVAGGAVSALGASLPAPAQSALDLLARMSAPLALLVIGGMLASLPATGSVRAVALVVGGKLVLHPLAVGAGVLLVPGVSPVMAAGGVLFAAMPMITIFPLLATRVGQARFAAFGLLVATLGGFITLQFVIFGLGLAQP
ncbi:MAG: AEC family transporter [Rhodobacteraceae bacterium]|nr:AEC family transporter [Paracoccaceae bacterium]TVR45891.1 MAG: AEC family transporter [Paracoccaceae bacterium]